MCFFLLAFKLSNNVLSTPVAFGGILLAAASRALFPLSREQNLSRGCAQLLANTFRFFGLRIGIASKRKRDINTTILRGSILIEGQRFSNLHWKRSVVDSRNSFGHKIHKLSQMISLPRDGSYINQQITRWCLALHDAVSVDVGGHQDFFDLVERNGLLELLELVR